MKFARLLVTCLLVAVSTTGLAVAGPTYTILTGQSTPDAGGFPFANANDTGSNKFLTDFAVLNPIKSGGYLLNLDLDFGSSVLFTNVLYTDRTSSGGINGGASYGTSDFATAIRYIFSSNSDFASNHIIAQIDVANRTAPTGVTAGDPNGYLAFQTYTTIPGVTAQYVRFEVTASTGPHPGAADLSFNTPEPSTGMFLGMGLLAGFGFLRRRGFRA